MPPRRKCNKGDKFGKWTVLIPFYQLSKSKKYSHLCRCECGTEKPVQSGDLYNGKSFSCGCHHNECSTLMYERWQGMIRRCHEKTHSSYYKYGKRGIKVCQEWFNYDNFIRDMGYPPFEGASIDRIDNEKGYYKENCRWANAFQQSQNQRVRKDNKTGVRGVSIMKDGRYHVQINRFKKKYYLGIYDSIEQAKQAIEIKLQQLEELNNG